MAFDVLTDLCSDKRYSYEPIYLYNPNLSTLENILTYFNKPEAELHKIKELKDDNYYNMEEVFSIKGVWGKEAFFSIRKTEGVFLFGWRHEYCLQQRSWQYIIRDISGHYSSGFF